jgi:hypothetical protein
MATSRKTQSSAPDKSGAEQPRAKGARVALDLETAQKVGFLGYEVDPTDDHAYTVAGVLAGKPTPETDSKAAAAAKEATS